MLARIVRTIACRLFAAPFLLFGVAVLFGGARGGIDESSLWGDVRHTRQADSRLPLQRGLWALLILLAASQFYGELGVDRGTFLRRLQAGGSWEGNLCRDTICSPYHGAHPL